jgi:hypothetical protein
MSSQEASREQRGHPVGSALASLEFTRRNFDNPALEWRRLFAEILGLFCSCWWEPEEGSWARSATGKSAEPPR